MGWQLEPSGVDSLISCLHISVMYLIWLCDSRKVTSTPDPGVEAVTSLLYLTSSRPDIMYATCLRGRFQADPREPHLLAVKIIFKYLKGTINLGLWYPRDSDFKLIGYSDADCVGCKIDRKTTFGSCQFFGGRTILDPMRLGLLSQLDPQSQTKIATFQTVMDALQFPAHESYTTFMGDAEMRRFYNEIGYDKDLKNLAQLKRNVLRKEWNFFFDCITKAFNNKSSNFDFTSCKKEKLKLAFRVEAPVEKPQKELDDDEENATLSSRFPNLNSDSSPRPVGLLTDEGTSNDVVQSARNTDKTGTSPRPRKRKLSKAYYTQNLLKIKKEIAKETQSASTPNRDFQTNPDAPVELSDSPMKQPRKRVREITHEQVE
ncbi:hypothetical protein AgCh_012106 [Apium graveolens]